MTGHYAFAFIVLAYILLPLVAYLIYWLWTRIRRRNNTHADSESET